eukprot:CAMPEP_0179251046 /NCGR_PEP_ID=MMETSP0797-20121207/21487_1 /TAXON_ID=47934 /ORGANISM="Dinophysis acuminata, Strain DAEP01" /LENGTH=99 /DNA_ID=CAMNT_0020958813 /DNA_START=30 /DNA_END=325 /DNA_ORIENTATION=+
MESESALVPVEAPELAMAEMAPQEPSSATGVVLVEGSHAAAAWGVPTPQKRTGAKRDISWLYSSMVAPLRSGPAATERLVSPTRGALQLAGWLREGGAG